MDGKINNRQVQSLNNRTGERRTICSIPVCVHDCRISRQEAWHSRSASLRALLTGW